MTLKMKRAGGWSTVPNGKLRVKNAGVWKSPSKVHRKMGAYGGGYWTDHATADPTGYRGPPSVPAGFAILGWTFEKVDASWSNPGGTIPVVSYDFEITDASDNLVYRWPNLTNTFFKMTETGLSLSHDTNYHARVRSRSAEGVYSDYAYIRFHLGHPQQTAQRWVTKTRSYFTSKGDVACWRDQASGLAIPTRVRIDGIRVFFKASWGAGWLSYPNEARRIYPLRNGVPQLPPNSNNPSYYIDADPAWGYWLGGDNRGVGFTSDWSNGGQWGVYCWGDGWSVYAGPYYFSGSMEFYGIQEYDELETYVSVSQVNNYYW